jgi:hypothetical protein
MGGSYLEATHCLQAASINRAHLTPQGWALSILAGSFTWVPKLAMTFVDIRDVAKAHLCAGVDVKWHGRNLICSCSDTFMALGQMVRTECQFENVATDYCPYCPLMCVPSVPLGE